MAFTTDIAAKLTRDASSLPSDGQPAGYLQRLLQADLAAVHLFSRSARPAATRLLAISISKLGNGWIYLLLLPAVVFALGWRSEPVVLLAALNAALLHILYPILKRRFGRKRPFQADPRLTSLLKTLDQHSFPSGHAMTLTGVLTPIVARLAPATVSAAVLIVSMAWSRIATAHHYPSDVAAGMLLGAAVAFPLSTYGLALF